MAKQIKTNIQIEASIEKVWSVLTDFENYPDWNPIIKSVKGEVKKGQQIEIKIQNMTFKPLVLTFDKHKEIKWLGHFLWKGVFDGEHQFKLSQISNKTTFIEQNENFSGILVKLFAKNLLKDTQAGFEAMNKCIKMRSERID